MYIAHSVRSKFATWSEALIHAWKVIKLQWAMLVGVVKFSYHKVDGSVRQAVGTLDIDYKRLSDRPVKYNLFTYFDTEANDFRSARVENLIF